MICGNRALHAAFAIIHSLPRPKHLLSIERNRSCCREIEYATARIRRLRLRDSGWNRLSSPDWESLNSELKWINS